MNKYNYPKLYKKYQKKALIKTLLEMGYPIIPLSAHDTVTQIGYGYKQKRIWCADFNLTPGVGLARDKKVTCDFLNNIGVPATKSYRIKTKEKLEKIIEKIGFPLVMKPARGTHGGKGVKVNILSKEEAFSAFNEIKKIEDKIHIEKYLEGDDHRVLVINYKAVAVLRRIPANVTGDGKSTIKQLIEKENIRRQALPPEKKASLWTIAMDKTTDETLAKQGLTLESIPKLDENIRLRFNSNVGTGGETVGLTNKIHPETKQLCEKAARLMGLTIAGVDVISTNISKPMKETGSEIIEVNTRPGIVMHQFPGSGEPVDTISIFAKEILGPKEDLLIPISIGGKICQDSSTIEGLLDSVPKKVVQYKNWQNKKEVSVNSPQDTLASYLMDVLTTKVAL